MKLINLLTLPLFVCVQLNAQDAPQKFSVPPVSPDPNQIFEILHFEPLTNNKFSIVYYQKVYGSVVTGGEFIPDTGSAVYVNSKRAEMVPYSGQATLLVKQIVEADGKATTEQVWLLANRKMESAGEYRLYLRRSFNHPIIKSNVPVSLTLHNLDAVKGLSDNEYNALVTQVNRMFPQQQEGYKQAAYKAPTIADDITRTKEQFKALRQAGHALRGDLPKSESVLTRYSMRPDRGFVITKTKGDSYLLKFYLTEDFKTFDLVDSSRVDGKVDLNSVASLYDRNANVVGAVANLVNKTKNEKGEEVVQQLTYTLDRDFQISGWKHSVGKNKLNSLQAEMGWYNGDRLILMSTNNEKFFKPYYMLHELTKGKDAQMIYPANAEETGTEKNIYVKSYQPEGPVGVAPPIAEKKVPIAFSFVRGTQYIFTQGMKKDPATNTQQYLAMSVIRISPEGKLTNIDMLPGYVSAAPLPLHPLVENPDQSFFVASYMNKLQLKLEKDGYEVSPVNSNTEVLDTKMDGEFIVKNKLGATMIKRSANGTNRTLYFYPEVE